ncbi:hypothetical protein R1sor_009621 [Riccia sorocarpa]|uniref:Uncharacterized protein n=1 Tax=Riccia sorocarpa TaxID=122646 RepID=A0ABD3HZ55_9MARC
MHSATECQAGEIKRGTLEEADLIRSFARLSVEGTPGAYTMVERNMEIEASMILRFAQTFAVEARAEATKVLDDARAEAEQLLSSARADAGAIPSSCSVLIGDKEKLRRERDALRKRVKYRKSRSTDESHGVEQPRDAERDLASRTIRRIVTELINLLTRTTRSSSLNPTLLNVKEMCCYCPSCIDEDGENCGNLEYTGPWTMHNVHPRKPADVVDYVDAIGYGHQSDEGTIADLVEVGDFFVVEVEWPNDYNAERESSGFFSAQSPCMF